MQDEREKELEAEEINGLMYLQKLYSNLVLWNNASLGFDIGAKGTLFGQTEKCFIQTQNGLFQLILFDVG